MNFFEIPKACPDASARTKSRIMEHPNLSIVGHPRPTVSFGTSVLCYDEDTELLIWLPTAELEST